MESAFRELKTARQIGRELAVPLHRVDYAIQRLGMVETARVGIVRLFDARQAADIAAAIGQIAARRWSVATPISQLAVAR